MKKWLLKKILKYTFSDFYLVLEIFWERLYPEEFEMGCKNFIEYQKTIDK